MPDVLFSSYLLGNVELKNRVVMSPMTRCRAPGHVPGDLMAEYYTQRAEAGLIVTEGTSPSQNGLGYARIPGLFSTEQLQGWRKVTESVHRAGGKIFVQLMHTGRTSHPLNMPAGARILAPSAIGLSGAMWTDQQQMQPYPTPTPMTAADIEETLNEYARCAGLAIEAGFDGIELHGANGYLIDQFLNTATNKRTDEWGGGISNRIRFAVEAVKRCAARVGSSRIGIRLSPFGAFNDMATDPGMEDTFEQLAGELARAGILYVHIVDHSSMGAPVVPQSVKDKIRRVFRGTVILAGGYDRARAEADLTAKRGDLIAFGRPFISNARLVSKLKQAKPLVTPNLDLAYTPGPQGYTDYPAGV
jgi:N-ethylmaleimide reductase